MTECSDVEQWLPAVGFEGCYEVSDLGQVRSLDRVTISKTGRSRFFRGRTLKQPFSGNGRQEEVNLCRNGIQTPKLVYHLVLTAFRGPRPPGMDGCHNNGIETDNRLVNLRWDTHEANMQDMSRHGRSHWGNRVCCPREHPLVVPNLVPSILAKGRRECLACARIKSGNRKSPAFKAKADANYAKIMAGLTPVVGRR